MEQQIIDRYSDAILQEAMRRHGIASDRLRPLDAFENFIYEFQRGPHAHILHIGHGLRKREAMV
jgi:hypothetical protein